jgi:hypothetical protein
MGLVSIGCARVRDRGLGEESRSKRNRARDGSMLGA